MQDRNGDMGTSELEREFELEIRDLLDQTSGRLNSESDDRAFDDREADDHEDIEHEFEMMFEIEEPDAFHEYAREDTDLG